MAINAKRLLKLADYLETVPRKQFDMTKWERETECGFAGCALGWAAHGKLFEGFSRRSSGGGRGDFFLHGEATDGFSAARHVFSIDFDDALRLFTEQVGDETPKQVSKRIRKFVRDNQAGASQ